MHRDLKPLNLLIDKESNYTVKIIDFGSSRVTDKDKTKTQGIGTVSYMAPGTFSRFPYRDFPSVFTETSRLPYRDLPKVYRDFPRFPYRVFC